MLNPWNGSNLGVSGFSSHSAVFKANLSGGSYKITLEKQSTAIVFNVFNFIGRLCCIQHFSTLRSNKMIIAPGSIKKTIPRNLKQAYVCCTLVSWLAGSSKTMAVVLIILALMYADKYWLKHGLLSTNEKMNFQTYGCPYFLWPLSIIKPVPCDSRYLNRLGSQFKANVNNKMVCKMLPLYKLDTFKNNNTPTHIDPNKAILRA